MQYTQYADKRDSRGSSSSSELANRQPAGRKERDRERGGGRKRWGQTHGELVATTKK